MTKEGQDITDYYAGDSLTITTTVYESDSQENTKDLSGASVNWILIDRAYDTEKLSKSTSGGGVEITDETGGEVQVTIEATDTESIDPGWYEHELEVEDAVDHVSTVLVGAFQIKGSKS